MKLKDMTLRITKGTTPNSSSYGKNEVTYIKSESLNYNGIIDESKFTTIDYETHNTKLKRSILQKKDILYSIAGMNLGKVGIVDSKYLPANTNQAVAIITVNDDFIIPKYLYYYLQQQKIVSFVNSGVSQSAQPNINLAQIGNFDIELPSKGIQEKIVKILDNITNRINLNNKINNNLQELAKSIYYEKFKDKTKNGKLKDILDLHKKSIKSKDESLKYFPIDILPMNYLITRDGKTNEEAQSSLIEFKKYDILVGAMRVYFHRVCLAAEDGITRTTTFVLRPKNEDYLYYSLITLDKDDFIKYANDGSKGSTMPYAVWDNNCNEYEIYVPTSNEAKEFNDIVKSLFEIQIINEKNNRYLEQLRDALLPKLMNGEIDLDNIRFNYTNCDL